jgi:hypothetical protein
MKKILPLVLIVAILGFGFYMFSKNQDTDSQMMPKQGSNMQGEGMGNNGEPAALRTKETHDETLDQLHEDVDLDEETIGFLTDALQDEYHAEAVYAKVMEDFGDDVRPFSNIIGAEKTHSDSIEDLFVLYGVEIPENEWANAELEGYVSVAEACAAGVEAEIANVALYDSFLEDIKYEDIKLVLTNLRDASEDNHLPAFERCAN